MNQQQIAAVYDSMTLEEQDMPREQFIREVTDVLDPKKMMAEADAIARGRIQKAQIDRAMERMG